VDASEISSKFEASLSEEGRDFYDYSIRMNTRELNPNIDGLFKEITRRDIVLFKYLPEAFKDAMNEFPPDRGRLNAETPSLIHKYYIAIVKNRSSHYTEQK
jgi:hypothetical protein